MEGAGLYLHCPFCSFVCPYCDFAVRRLGDRDLGGFVATILREAELRADWPEAIDSIYLGGGTPSLLPPAELERLLGGLRARLPIVPGAVLHLEANPEDVDDEALGAWRDLGVRFLSLGVQSLDDRALRFLGRRHDARGARQAIARAVAAGFEVVSVDLIFGLPDQDRARWLADIEAATPPGVDHLSCYQLTVKPGTLFSRRVELGRLAEIGDEEQGRFFAFTHEVLEARGFEAYEVSNFARRPDARSRHNRKYWRQVPYLGLGPAAHSFTGRERFWNEAEEGAWTAAIQADRLPEAGRERLEDLDLAQEALLLGLRCPEGVDLARLESRWSFRPSARALARLETFVTAGLLEHEGTRIKPSRRGLAVADSIAADLAC